MPSTTQVSLYEKGKTNLDLLQQVIVSGSSISWALCKSATCTRQETTQAPHNWRGLPWAGWPLCHSTNSIKVLKSIVIYGAKTVV